MYHTSVRNFNRWLAPTLKVLKSKKNNLPPRKPDPRKSFVEWNYEAEIYAFGKRLGENFDNNLLKRALTMKSYVEHEENQQKQVGMEPEIQLLSNDELVEKGHQIMDQYISKYLKQALPKLPDSYLLKIKEYLMSEETLSHVSKCIGIDDILLVPEDFPKPEELCCGLKAVVQALENKARAEKLIRDLVVSQLCGYDLTKLTTPDRPVEELNQIYSKMSKELEYRLIAESGVNTLLPVYHVGVYCDKNYLGKGVGESITVAKEMAACDVLWRIWGVSRRKPFKMDLEPSKPVIKTSPVIDITSHVVSENVENIQPKAT